MADFLDFFSDTKTRPTAAMRRAMAEAEVGDERAGEDPTVNRLVARCAALLGKPAAIYLPSGTMCNEIALAVHCRPGDEVLCDTTSHLIGFEGGGPAALAGVMLQAIPGDRGRYSAGQLGEALRPDRPYAPRQRLVTVEQTANLGGGAIWPLQQLAAVASTARAAGLATHMDGARLFNACVATGTAPSAHAEGYDSVWVDFSKGLGAPGGAVLAGDTGFVAEAERLKLRWGGAMRQSGIIAAACEYALDHHIDRLADDHANARRLAQGLARLPGLRIDPDTVETNLVYFDVIDPRRDAAALCAALMERGVRMGPMGRHTVRAVTHLDVDAAAVDAALQAVAACLG
ncbi:threonine aldolase family protein [Tahibacter amnicola]|uniref:Aminotransferase class I/II-fold pyridoxal phosphate-dependent enzyme n=1 Tax=Tahibacter amnicola TaxID=2976241 RepID=A0ABY6BGZ1_9GAMM|nr:GntG family PLP-dependent aldolase [Tahibacter amnicola]UXI69134.1 aminotransferase class I/II-fold pyridoxal phosphate-dependent enzyme [Tahibacter amnicola]